MGLHLSVLHPSWLYDLLHPHDQRACPHLLPRLRGEECRMSRREEILADRKAFLDAMAETGMVQVNKSDFRDSVQDRKSVV